MATLPLCKVVPTETIKERRGARCCECTATLLRYLKFVAFIACLTFTWGALFLFRVGAWFEAHPPVRGTIERVLPPSVASIRCAVWNCSTTLTGRPTCADWPGIGRCRIENVECSQVCQYRRQIRFAVSGDWVFESPNYQCVEFLESCFQKAYDAVPIGSVFEGRVVEERVVDTLEVPNDVIKYAELAGILWMVPLGMLLPTVCCSHTRKQWVCWAC